MDTAPWNGSGNDRILLITPFRGLFSALKTRFLMDSLFPTASAHEYTITSDLSQLCLPREYKDSNRRLAWANSVCCLFVIIGIAGLKPPKANVKPLSTPNEIIPVVINQPEETPPTPQDQPPEPDTTPEVTPETPV